jgi:hypothetical protein
MLWKKNAGDAKRALFIDDPKHVDDEGRKLVRVEPAGAIARFFVSDLYVPVNGKQARESSRRTIDECGFGATFDLFESFNALAAAKGVLDLRYAGTGEIDGRATHVIVRSLPYQGEGGPYPDAKMVMHLDQEWLLPVAVFSYADQDETQLLGSYVFKDISLAPGFDANAFKF